ncbi:LOW QUALITY PROTEIN: hypothetical protein U9M48_043734 [Paspalum notatum var. saurae]|uniref:Uncharacterized protein n=1 Tax=Paspalum notatum var. saurae TaxID=547442 RepID=A0AAQ3UXS5_PASNO
MILVPSTAVTCDIGRLYSFSSTMVYPKSGSLMNTTPAPPASRTASMELIGGTGVSVSHTTTMPRVHLGAELPVLSQRLALERLAVAEPHGGALRSTDPAPTVRIHGASLDSVDGCGPLLPPAHTTRTPLDTAANAPMAIGSLSSGVEMPPSDKERTSTPSFTAASIPASRSDSKQPWASQTLYTARCAPGAVPAAVPPAAPRPNAEAPSTNAPAAVPVVCVPWPTSSSVVLSTTKDAAPMSLLLQRTGGWHAPFHLAGGGGMPSSRNEGCFSSMPVSRNPMMAPSP